jgi:hypothetical protein
LVGDEGGDRQPESINVEVEGTEMKRSNDA